MRPCRQTPELRAKQLKQDNASRRRRYAENKEKRLEENREWKKRNADKVRTYNRNRKSLVRATGSFTFSEIELILQEQGNKCPGCFKTFSDDLPFTLDHFVPLSRGGSNTASNIQLMCRTCNCSKRHSLWTEWIKTNG